MIKRVPKQLIISNLVDKFYVEKSSHVGTKFLVNYWHNFITFKPKQTVLSCLIGFVLVFSVFIVWNRAIAQMTFEYEALIMADVLVKDLYFDCCVFKNDMLLSIDTTHLKIIIRWLFNWWVLLLETNFKVSIWKLNHLLRCTGVYYGVLFTYAYRSGTLWETLCACNACTMRRKLQLSKIKTIHRFIVYLATGSYSQVNNARSIDVRVTQSFMNTGTCDLRPWRPALRLMHRWYTFETRTVPKAKHFAGLISGIQ